MQNKVKAIVPIKAYSERLTSKNFLELEGKPMFLEILGTLQACPSVEEIVVDSDSDEILELSSQFSKVLTMKRSEAIMGNTVTMNTILAHDLQLIEGEHFLQTHVTNPLIQVHTIEKAIQQYFEKLGEYDALYTVDAIQKRAYTHESQPINHDLDVMLQTQDLNPVYIENSNLFIFSKTAFKAGNNNRLGSKPQAFPMHPIEGMDIDYGEDYNLVKLIIENKHLFPNIFQ